MGNLTTRELPSLFQNSIPGLIAGDGCFSPQIRLSQNARKLDLCYTYRVNSDQQIWQVWHETLQRWGLDDLTALILDALGPLNLLGAQVVYLSQPFLGQLLPEGHWDTLAEVLENPAQTKAFSAFLRQTDQSI